MYKILTFIDWFWPGYKAGGPVRSMLNLTEHLSEEFEFHIVTRDTDYMSNEPYDGVDSNRWNEIKPNIKVYYISQEQLSRKLIRSFVIDSDQFDLIYINGIYSFYFSILPLYYARKFRKDHVVAPRGMLSGQTFSSKKNLKKLFFLFSRIMGLYKNARFHATIEKEANDITNILGTDPSKISIAPNLPRRTLPDKIPLRKKEKGDLKLISIARIAPEKNIIFAIRMLSGIHDGRIKFSLFGETYNPEYWKECKALIKGLPESTIVEHKGSINSDDIPKVLLNHHFLFMPSKGENFGHSILESMMSGCPVIISDKTPWRDLELETAGWDIPLDKPEEFQKVLNRCLNMSQDEYDRYSEGALKIARAFVNNPELAAKSKNMFYGKS